MDELSRMHSGTTQPTSRPDGPPPDCRVQIRKLRDLVDSWKPDVRAFNLDRPGDIGRFHAEIGLSRKGEGEPTVVIGGNVGAELGHPDTVSHAIVLTTSDHEAVRDGLVQCIGPDLDRARPEDRLAFAQVVLASCDPEDLPDPFQLESTQYLANRLPGYMARTMPGRLWVRVGRRAIASGFRLKTLGFALISAFKMDHPGLRRVEAILVTGDPDRVFALDSIAAEARVAAGRHRKLVYVENGLYRCDDLNCETCEERSTCDALQDIAVRYRKASTP